MTSIRSIKWDKHKNTVNLSKLKVMQINNETHVFSCSLATDFKTVISTIDNGESTRLIPPCLVKAERIHPFQEAIRSYESQDFIMPVTQRSSEEVCVL